MKEAYLNKMTETSNLLERAVSNTEECTTMLKKLLDEMIPQYFFMGALIGSQGDWRIVERGIKKFKLPPEMVEILNKGKEIWKKEHSSEKVCDKCKKTINIEIDTKFCSYCGKKLFGKIT